MASALLIVPIPVVDLQTLLNFASFILLLFQIRVTQSCSTLSLAVAPLSPGEVLCCWHPFRNLPWILIGSTASPWNPKHLMLCCPALSEWRFVIWHSAHRTGPSFGAPDEARAFALLQREVLSTDSLLSRPCLRQGPETLTAMVPMSTTGTRF